MTASLTTAQRDVIRRMLLTAISQASEDRWAAGWNSGCEVEFWQEGGDWHAIGELVGWPDGYRATAGWLTPEQADERVAERNAKWPR